MSDFDQAMAFHKQGRLELAEKHYHAALSENFDNVNCLYLLGTLYLQGGRHGLAANLFMRALNLKQGHFESWNNLGNCYKAVNKEDDAQSCFTKALNIKGKTDQDYADIYNNLATLYINAGCPQEGMPFAIEALKLAPSHADANWNLALLYLEQGVYDKGFDLYEWGFKTKNRLYREYGRDIPYWKGEHGKTVVVWGEQGIGDELMFASMIPDLVAVSKRVILECHPRLVNIFKESFPGLTVYGTRKDQLINWPHDEPDINAKIAIGDLGKFFRRKVADFPGTAYLKANPERIEFYRGKLGKLGSRPKIGISWTGGYLKTRKDFRSVSLSQWGDILKHDADFISLQYTPEAYATIAEAEEAFDVRIHHWPTAVQNNDYAETAALVEALDMVITVNTSIHHLAGALGKECWTLTPKGKAWRYWSPDGKRFPWYNSCRLFEQQDNTAKPIKGFESGDWGSVMRKTSLLLGERVRPCASTM